MMRLALLAHDPSTEDMRHYLRRRHGDVLPDGLFLDEAWTA